MDLALPGLRRRLSQPRRFLLPSIPMPTLRTKLLVGALFASTVLAQSPCFDPNIGVDLGAPLGAPGCTAFFLPGPSDMNLLNFTLGSPTTSFSAGVPNNNALIGLVAIAEAVSDDTGANAFGWKFSNGLRLTVGL